MAFVWTYVIGLETDFSYSLIHNGHHSRQCYIFEFTDLYLLTRLNGNLSLLFLKRCQNKSNINHTEASSGFRVKRHTVGCS